MLALLVAVIVLLGVLATPFLITAIAPGYSGPKAELLYNLSASSFLAPVCWFCWLVSRGFRTATISSCCPMPRRCFGTRR